MGAAEDLVVMIFFNHDALQISCSKKYFARIFSSFSGCIYIPYKSFITVGLSCVCEKLPDVKSKRDLNQLAQELSFSNANRRDWRHKLRGSHYIQTELQ